MITILSTLLGFLTSGIPSFLKLFQDRQDKKHELAIMQIQIEMAKMRIDSRLQEIQSLENIEEIKALYKKIPTGVAWIDSLDTLMRAFLALLIMVLYVVVTIMYFNILTHAPEGLTVYALDSLWTDEDQMLFGSIIGFYFGARHFNKKGNT